MRCVRNIQRLPCFAEERRRREKATKSSWKKAAALFKSAKKGRWSISRRRRGHDDDLVRTRAGTTGSAAKPRRKMSHVRRAEVSTVNPVAVRGKSAVHIRRTTPPAKRNGKHGRGHSGGRRHVPPVPVTPTAPTGPADVVFTANPVAPGSRQVLREHSRSEIARRKSGGSASTAVTPSSRAGNNKRKGGGRPTRASTADDSLGGGALAMLSSSAARSQHAGPAGRHSGTARPASPVDYLRTSAGSPASDVDADTARKRALSRTRMMERIQKMKGRHAASGGGSPDSGPTR